MKLDQNKQKILDLYTSGVSAAEIAREYDTDPQNIRYGLRKWLNTSDLRPNPGNTRYFENVDKPIKAYFLGFIAADGALVKSGGSTSLTISINIKDRIILDKLKEEIGNSHNLQILQRDQIRFVLSRKELIKDLRKYGLEERKSLTLGNFLANIPKEFRQAAILGYMDGDGSICWRKYGISSYKHCVSIRATDEVIRGILEEVPLETYSVSYSDTIPALNISSFAGILTFFQIYQSCDFYLSRKYDRFVELIHQVQTISSSSKKQQLLEFGARVPIIADLLKD